MKRTYIAITGLLMIASCLTLAPVFCEWKWGSQPQANLGQEQAYAYLWLHRDDTFSYYGLCAFNTFQMRASANLMLRDEQNRVQRVFIENVVAVVDGVEFPVPELASVELLMNRSIHNMYGGDGGSARLGFQLGAIPHGLVELRVRGTITAETGEVLPLRIVVNSIIQTDSARMMFWQYLLMHLHA